MTCRSDDVPFQLEHPVMPPVPVPKPAPAPTLFGVDPFEQIAGQLALPTERGKGLED